MLGDAGIVHECVDAGVDDGVLVQGAVTPEKWVMALAYLKARAGLSRVGGDDGTPVLGADTVIDKAGRVIGQPRDAAHAGAIIRTLRDGSHRVVTGVALVERCGAGVRRAMMLDAATVRLGAIGDEEIERYVASGDWKGKAGGYNFSERAAAGWPIACEGDPATVMGLPMKRLPGWLAGWTAAGL